ncbi:ER membrane protein complex subunit 10 [Condylostylus longicornis]|uniref:ER membrane protein complex subunit 10 n=1 Tax=Condylostylus longicornis TaxID=2530218 RepID=UPI00244D9CAE|nr:ER membrane protein complex subunit 10 [Condylostylus longicornis]
MSFLIFTTLVLLQISSGLCYLDYDSWLSIELQHAIDPENLDKFTFRGNVTIPSLNVGTSNIVQEPLGFNDRQNLKRLAQTNQFYRLKGIVLFNDGTKTTYLTSSKACTLATSQLTDILWISVDSMGFVTAITQTVSGSADCTGTNISTEDLENFNTDILVKHMELAPVPDTTTFIQKMEREREARERGEIRDNRGFFAKYWMYIVPVIILILISGTTNPEAQASGGR